MSELGIKLETFVRYQAERQPGFKYQKQWADNPAPDTGGKYWCLYVHNGEPSCLIGHAMWNAGLIDAGFESRRSNSNCFCSGLKWDIPALKQLDDAEWVWLSNVQLAQDGGKTWHDAVSNADDKLSASPGGNESNG